MAQLHELHLFAGAGGGILAGELLGHKPVCAVEINEYCRRVLHQRQDDGLLDPFPIWTDIETFDGRPWRGLVDVVSGGFPCQDISPAGKGAGITGARSGLWGEMARVVGQVRPRIVFVENSSELAGRGLTKVIGDLCSLGYRCIWDVFQASDVDAWHERARIWIVAYTDRCGQHVQPVNAEMGGSSPSVWQAEEHSADEYGVRRGTCDGAGNGSDSDNTRRDSRWRERATAWQVTSANRLPGWPVEPAVGRVAYGVAGRMGPIAALGNGQVPRVAATAFTLLTRRAGISFAPHGI